MEDYEVELEGSYFLAPYESFVPTFSSHSLAYGLPGKLLALILNILCHISATAISLLVRSPIPHLALIGAKSVDVLCFLFLHHLRSARTYWTQMSDSHKHPRTYPQRLYALPIHFVTLVIDICIFTWQPTPCPSPSWQPEPRPETRTTQGAETAARKPRAISQHVIYPPSPLEMLCSEEQVIISFKESMPEEDNVAGLAGKGHDVLEEGREDFRFGGIVSRMEAFDKVKTALESHQPFNHFPLLFGIPFSPRRSVSSNTASTTISREERINPRTMEEGKIEQAQNSSAPTLLLPVPPRRSSTPNPRTAYSDAPLSPERNHSSLKIDLSLDGANLGHNQCRQQCIAYATEAPKKKGDSRPKQEEGDASKEESLGRR